MSDPTQAPEPRKIQTAVVTLEEPIVRGEAKIEQVTVRRPTVGELRGFSMNSLLSSEVAAHAKLLTRISSPTILAHEIDAMSPADFSELVGEVVTFLLPKAARDSLTA